MPNPGSRRLTAPADPLRHLPGLAGLIYAEFPIAAGRLALPDVACDLIWTGDELRFIGPMSRGLVNATALPTVRLVTLGARHAAQLVGAPLSELTDANLPLADLAPRLAAPLEDLFASGGGARLVRREAGVARTNGALHRAAHALGNGAPPGAVARSFDITDRHFRRRFRAALGLGPGQFGRILRFRRAMNAATRGQGLAMASQLAGYADQPHFTRECRALTGLSPREALRRLGPDAEVLAGTREPGDGFD